MLLRIPLKFVPPVFPAISRHNIESEDYEHEFSFSINGLIDPVTISNIANEISQHLEK